MANVMISTVCNQRCSYCFAMDYQHLVPHTDSFIDMQDFVARLDFLDRSQIDTVRLMGGEPTLHPHFATLVQQAVAREKVVVVFTNGLMPEPAVACLEALPAGRCIVLVNVNMPDGNQAELHHQRLTTIRRLAKHVMLGFNLHRLDCQLDFLCTIIAETQCQSVIRIGIAHPCLSGENQFMHPKQYKVAGQKIMHFATVANQHHITLDFDCGFVRCMFSDEDLQELEAMGTRVGWHCNPVLDVDLEGNIFYCYPLATLWREPLTAATDATTLRRTFIEQAKRYRRAGIFPECATCGFKAAGECTGGCLAATIRRFRRASFTLAVPVVESV